MDEKATKRGGGAVAAMVLLAVLVLLPMIYVLSIGPVVWLANTGRISDSCQLVLAKVYWPLDWASDNVPIVGPAISWYAECWMPPQQPIYSAPTLPSTATVPPATLPPIDASAPVSGPSPATDPPAVPAPAGS